MLRKLINVLGVTGLSIPLGYKGLDIAQVVINEKKVTEKLAQNNYYAILEIPLINLKKELYPQSSSNNNVNKNVYVHPESIFPNNSNSSNIILASHSGNGLNAYFKNLYKLQIGNKVLIYYHDNLYTYEIKEIEYQAKTGSLYLKKEYDNMLTLITCTKNNHETQTIYYASLITQNAL